LISYHTSLVVSDESKTTVFPTYQLIFYLFSLHHSAIPISVYNKRRLSRLRLKKQQRDEFSVSITHIGRQQRAALPTGRLRRQSGSGSVAAAAAAAASCNLPSISATPSPLVKSVTPDRRLAAERLHRFLA
jgi:hypothetical protein